MEASSSSAAGPEDEERMGTGNAAADAALQGLESLEPVAGRMQLAARLRHGAAVYVDYAHTPDALQRLLTALRPHTKGALSIVFGCGGDRDRGKRPEMGAIAARLADRVIVTDDNPRSEDAAQIRAAILAAAPDATEIGAREQAIFEAVAGLVAGDILVIAGKGLARKREAVEKAVARLNGERDPLEILRRIGGREIAAMTGLIIAARLQRVPVIVDGFVTTAAAAVVYAMDPAGLDHCLFAHVSAEQAHAKVLEHMGKDALLDFGMRLGEGSGAALAAGIAKAAAEMHSGMATFADAGVSEKDD